MANSRDVARLAGVSQATVSRVLSNSSSVSEPTRDKVLRAMAEIGYVPNLGARAMKTGRANTIGVVVEDLINPIYPLLLNALTEQLEDAGMKVALWNSDRRENQAALEAIESRSVDGVIFTTVTEASPTLKAALERGNPLVLVHRGVSGLACDQVTSGNYVAGRTVAAHFWSRGHRNVAVIGNAETVSTSRLRRKGFIEQFAEYGVRVDPGQVLLRDFTYEFGAESARRLLTSAHPPSAVFCTNDLAAIGAVDAARELGVAIPGDLSVIGFDDIPMAGWSSYRLTTMRQPVETLAAEGTRLILERINDRGKPPEQLELDCELIVRATTT